MIWDMATVYAIRGYRAEGTMDQTAAQEGALQAMDAELFRVLQETINEAWPVVIDAADCQTLRISGNPRIPVDTYQMAWRPDRPGEIMGGTHDGLTIAGPDWTTNGPHRIRLPDQPTTQPTTILAMRVSDPITGEHPIVPPRANHSTTYTLDGWSDLHRRWIYIPEGTR